MSTPAPTPITVSNPKKTLYLSTNNNGNGSNGYLQHNLIGSGYQGPEVMARIPMSLKSGIGSEIEWALSYLTHLSCSDSHLINFEESPYLGNELIKYFIKPFQLILDKQEINQGIISLSLDSLLSLRNLSQDLVNQQWLSQVKSLKKNIIEVLKFFINWFCQDSDRPYHLQRYNNQFREGFNYLIDLIEPLSSYYIDNTKNDPLFNQLLIASTLTKDKYLFINILRSLSHLLIIRDKSFKIDDDNQNKQDDDQVEIAPNNCIDAIQESHLEHYVNNLLVNDNELTITVLDFLKQYLTSEALHSQYPYSTKDSQLYRLKKLLQINTTKSVYHTLIKQLPLLIVSNLPLNDPCKIPSIPPLNLSRRSKSVGVPTTLPQLPKQLYDIIVKFPEPLRATTWLRCCYEPYINTSSSSSSGDAIPGEVTQISLWKSYEKQFEEVWQTSKTQPNPEWPPLLPAVDFIKNVNNAFPNSEAMVVNLESVSPGQPPKKKFIIKGIQPRQFVVNIDVANYEALKHRSSLEHSDSVQNLPIGHIDVDKFNHSLNNLSNQILSQGTQVNKKSKELNQINLIALELLDYIINELLETEEDSNDLENVFRLYNKHWLPGLIYANPSLVESGVINSKWLKYLI